MNKKQVLVIDDNAEFRESMSWLLTGMGHDVLDFDDPQKGINNLVDNSECACVLLDVRMPNLSGLDVHDKLLQAGCSVPVVYMTGHGDVSLAVEAMKKGAITFLEKPIDPELLGSALAKAFECNEQNSKYAEEHKKAAHFREDLKKLTPREIEVMDAIVDGSANKVIAFDLGISLKTVELHRSRVMKKLPVRSPQELVRMVMLSQ